MIFPLEQLILFEGNIYEITCAANRRAYQLSVMGDGANGDYSKPVSLAARQVFERQVEYRIEK